MQMTGEQYDLFRRNAEAVQARVSRISSPRDAVAYATDLVRRREAGARTLAVPDFDAAAVAAFADVFERDGVELIVDGMRAHSGGVAVGLTWADLGIAETGSLVIDSAGEDLRLATMLPEIHVAVLPESRLRATSFDVAAELERILASSAGYVAFITGASRTADIERILALGVHGPLELHILVLEEVSA